MTSVPHSGAKSVTRDAEHTPSPQSVVVPVDRGVAGVIMDGLWPILGGNHTDAEVWTEIGEVVSSALAAAPAPSSLAGGEWLETEGARVGIVNIIERHISGWAGEHADSPYDAAVEIGRDIFHLAALSPEAPAREGGKHQTVGPIDYDKLRSIIHSATNAVLPFANAPMKTPFSTQERAGMQVEIADLIVADLEKAGGRTPALTPRHEALAPTCQKCGGEVQGWTCQECGASFRENDEGSLVFACHEAPAEGAGEDSPITAAIRARLAKVKATTYNFGTPAESLKAGEMHGLNTALAIAMVEDERALRARSSAPEARDILAVCRAISDDYQTSETHHPNHVLVRKDRFDALVSLLNKQPEAREGEAPVACPKCGMLSGDDWKQCGGSCPMPGSPHHTHPAAPSADKLRIAVEALEAINAHRIGRDPPNVWTGSDICRGIATKALATLKTEGC